MRRFTLSLVKSFQRPIIMLNNWYNFRVLLDTGALFPVWTASEELLLELGGALIQKNVGFSGFGGSTIGNLYRLPMVSVGDLVFTDLPIVACGDLSDVPYQLILSATMFQNLIYEIDDEKHRFSVTIPDGESLSRRLRIKDSNGRLHVLCHSVETGGYDGGNRIGKY